MSMQIDKTNYEAFALDFLEGNLKGEALRAFEAFLATHPEIAGELFDMHEVKLNAASTASLDKANMKVHVVPVGPMDERNMDSYFASAVDADLNPKDAEVVAAFLKVNPAFESEFARYQRSVLSADASVAFEAKASLKKAIPLWQAQPTWMRAAAAVALLMGMFWWMNLSDSQYVPREGVLRLAPLATMESTPAVKGKPTNDRETVAEAIPQPRSIESVAMLTPPKAAPTVITRAHPAALQGLDESPALAVVALPALPESGSTEPLNVAQFIGKRMLDVPPEESENARELLVAGVQRVIEDNPNLDYQNEEVEGKRRSIRLLAGAIEFQRVTYQSN